MKLGNTLYDTLSSIRQEQNDYLTQETKTKFKITHRFEAWDSEDWPNGRMMMMLTFISASIWRERVWN